MKKISSIDLFAGVGGMRIALAKALKKIGYIDDCKLYSEIDTYSQQTYTENFPMTKLIEDIKSVAKKDIDVMIPNHDIFISWFPMSAIFKSGYFKKKKS